MALYNNGFPVGYPQAYYPQQVPTQQPQPANNGIIWVQGESAAKSYPVAPNSSVPLWDSEANIIYIKSADMSGMPSIKVLDYSIRNTAPKTAEAVPQVNFATKDDISHLEEEISALKAKLDRANSSDRRREKQDGKRPVQSDE